MSRIGPFDQHLSTVLDGKQVNEMLKGMPLLKFIRRNGVHHGMTYIDGLNEDILPFSPTAQCSAGGIYVTTLEDSFQWTGYGPCARRVTLPDDAKIYVENCKLKCNKVIFGVLNEREDLLAELVMEYYSSRDLMPYGLGQWWDQCVAHHQNADGTFGKLHHTTFKEYQMHIMENESKMRQYINENNCIGLISMRPMYYDDEWKRRVVPCLPKIINYFDDVKEVVSTAQQYPQTIEHMSESHLLEFHSAVKDDLFKDGKINVSVLEICSQSNRFMQLCTNSSEFQIALCQSLRQFPKLVKYIDPKIKECANYLIMNNQSGIGKYILASFEHTTENLEECIKTTPEMIRFFKRSQRTPRMISCALQRDGMTIRHIDVRDRTYDMYKEAITQNPMAAKYLKNTDIIRYLELIRMAIDLDYNVINHLNFLNSDDRMKMMAYAVSVCPDAIKYVAKRKRATVLRMIAK